MKQPAAAVESSLGAQPGARRIATLLAVAIAGLGLALAWRRRFVLDDAFITFQYARSLVTGGGLTWFGDRVEGYTSFLWVLWTALGLRFGADPIAWSWAAGLVSFALLLHATWRLGERLCGSPWPALVALLLLATNATVTAFATSGLETMLQAALLAQAALRSVRLRDAIAATSVAAKTPTVNAVARHAAILSIWLTAAVLTRLDSVVPATFFAADAYATLRRVAARPDRRRALRNLVLPALVCLVAWFGWKLAYYGSILPNTFAAKVHWEVSALAAGCLYLWRFLAAYWLWPFAIASAACWLLGRVSVPDGTQRTWATLAIAMLAWWVYLAMVGGDFMEFRMLVPVLSFFFLLLVQPVWRLAPRIAPFAAVAVVLVLEFASLQHTRHFRGVSPDRRLDAVPALANFYGVYPDRNWSSLGLELHEQLGATRAVLALHAVGAIPYYSGLRTVDMYGLTDRDIAHHGIPAPASYMRPGHRRQATVEQLRQRGTNLVVAHPTIEGRGVVADPRHAAAGTQWVQGTLMSPLDVNFATVVGMPLRHRPGVLRIWYLTPSAAIDSVIAANGWETSTVPVR